MEITRIKWETDGQDVNLPTEVDTPEGIDDEDSICNYLSDTYGYLVLEFAMPTDHDDFGDYVNMAEGMVS
jgi:hypothetical protein